MIGSGSVARLCHESDDFHLKLLLLEVSIELIIIIVIILTLSMIARRTIMHTLV